MWVLKFTLSGKTAFFKKPEVNSYYYFTYGNIHKVALMGMFGAILGYQGYNQMDQKEDYPEFYEKLMHINLSIVPKSKSGHMVKKIQHFNNSVGYASKEQGGNLIVKEQWLENPEWDIYVLIENDVTEKLSEYMMNKRSVYIPYLGKNDHMADISNVIRIDQVVFSDEFSFINSLVPKDWVVLDADYDDDCDENLFKYEEYLPVSLDKDTNLHKLENFVFTNMKLAKAECKAAKISGMNIVFY